MGRVLQSRREGVNSSAAANRQISRSPGHLSYPGLRHEPFHRKGLWNGIGRTASFAQIDGLFLAVCLNVILGSVLGMLDGMNVMAMSQMRVMGSGFVVAVQVMLGGFMVMTRSVLMMFRCLRVMMGCFV